MMRCMTAICPAGPPKLSAATRVQTRTASLNEMPWPGASMDWTEATSKLSILFMASSCSSAALGAEILVEVVEDWRALRDALLILRIGRANSRDEASDTRRLLASELRVL